MTTTTTNDLGQICMKGDKEALRAFLLQKDASLDVTLPVAWTDKDEKSLHSPPMFICVDYGHVALVEMLLSHGGGVDVNGQDEHGYTAAQWAAWKGAVDMLQLLMAHGATVDQDALDLAQEEGEDKGATSRQQVVDLIRQHMDPYANLEGDEDEIMMKACREGDLTKVTDMLSAGYDYNKWKVPEDGKYQLFSPMNMAVKRGHFDIVQLFMEEGVPLEHGMEQNASEAAETVVPTSEPPVELTEKDVKPEHFDMVQRILQEEGVPPLETLATEKSPEAVQTAETKAVPTETAESNS